MEMTCKRCHQAVQEEDCYCPACGLPQLLYTNESAPGQAEPEHWDKAVPDASQVAWKLALRLCAMLAVPAGLLCSLFSPLSILSFLLMAIVAAWVVAIYMRSQRPAWITIGAGARIGLVTGLLGGWTAAATTGCTLFAMRFLVRQGNFFDGFWQTFVNQQFSQQYAAMGIDAQTIASYQKWMLSPEGRAGSILGVILFLMAGLMICATVGGALGARLLAGTRKPEV
jgi:hypothetical protein